MRRPVLKAAAAAVAVSAALLLCSCAPSHELKKLSLVEGVGLDAGDSQNLNMTFQVFNTQESPQSGGKGGSEPLLARGSGASAFDAIRNATLQAQNRLYFANAEIYLLGEPLCRGGIGGLVDFFERPTDIRPMARLAVVRGGTADSALTASRQGQIIQAEQIDAMLSNYHASSKMWNFLVRDFTEDESNGLTDLALPAVRVGQSGKDGTSVESAGTAIFRSNRLMGYLDDLQTRGLMWVTGKAGSAMITVVPLSGTKVTLEVTKAGASIAPAVTGGKTGIAVSINIASNVAEISGSGVDVTQQASIQRLERLEAEEVKREALSAVETALYGWGADVFGFGSKLYHRDPSAWRQIAPHWSSYLRTMPVSVTVQATIAMTAMTTN